MTFSVKVADIDTSLLGNGGRTLIIKPKNRKGFTTPTRPFSLPEFISKSYLAFRGTIDGHLGAIQVDMTKRKYERFLKKNGTVYNIRRRITSYSDRMCCFENFIVLDVKPESPSHQTALKLYLETQLRVKYLNYIAMPQISTTDMKLFGKMVVDWRDNAENYGKGAIPQLSLNEDLKIFQAKLNLLCELAESGVIDIINLRYANPEYYQHQYISLWEKRETNVLFNCYGVPRKGKHVSSDITETPILEIQRYGIDTITPLTRTPTRKWIYSQQFKEEPKQTSELVYGWSYYPAGLVFPSDVWQNQESHSVECSCKVCKRKSQKEILQTYCYNDEGKIDSSAMQYASKLHDGLSAELEYQKIKKYIGSNEMLTYDDEINEYRKKHFNI